MPFRNWNLGWRAHNEQRRYPILDGCSATDTTGTFEIPDSLLVGLYLPLPFVPSIDANRLYIARMVVAPGMIEIVVSQSGLDEDDDPVLVARGLAYTAGHVPGRAYRLIASSQAGHGDAQGLFAVGTFDELDERPPGIYHFDPEATRLEPDCFRPQLRGVTSLYVSNGETRIGPLYGSIELVAGRNCQLVAELFGQLTRLRVDAIDGAGLSDDCSCTSEATLGPPVRTIGLVGPDANGNIDLLGSECVTITAGRNALRLENPCATPCCGRPELEALADQIRHLGDQATTLETAVARLAEAVDQTERVVLGSRFNAANCQTC